MLVEFMFMVSISRIIILLVIVLILLWLVLARPGFAVKSGRPPAEGTVDPDRLKQHVSMLASTLYPRSYNYPANLDKVAAYIATSLHTSGARVSEQVYQVAGSTYKNVIAEYGPDSNSITVVGAHYDTAGEQPGADDNASGVAGLLELGRLLSETDLDAKVLLVAFTLEEPPFFTSNDMGSTVFAQALRKQGTEIRLMISLEMIGYFADDKGSQHYPSPVMKLFYPSSGNFIAIVDRLFSLQAQQMKQRMRQVMELPVYSINAPSFIPGIDFSDHRSFWRSGYPAVMITDTAFYRNQAYHSEADTADRLDYDKMARVVYGVYDYVCHISQIRKRD